MSNIYAEDQQKVLDSWTAEDDYAVISGELADDVGSIVLKAVEKTLGLKIYVKGPTAMHQSRQIG